MASLAACITCGHVGCCDDSKNKHAAKHFHSTNHPLIKSFEPGEEWGWCYVDELLLESVPGSLTEDWCGVLGATNQELLVTMDDPGEDTLEEDTFHSQAGNTTGHNFV